MSVLCVIPTWRIARPSSSCKLVATVQSRCECRSMPTLRDLAFDAATHSSASRVVPPLVPFMLGVGGTARESTSRTSRESPCHPYCAGVTGTRRHVTWSAHNPKVAGSNPAPATNEIAGKARCESAGPSACGAENGAATRRIRRRRGAAEPEGRAFSPRNATCSCRPVPVAPVACRSVPRVDPASGIDDALRRNRIGSITRRSGA